MIGAILVYNYFFGTREEKAQSKEVFKKTGETLGAAWSLLRAEKTKFDAGKYDGVMDKLGGAYETVRAKAKYVDENVLQRVDELERRKQALEEELRAIQAEEKMTTQEPPPAPKKGVKTDSKTPQTYTTSKAADLQRRKEQLQREMEKLVTDTDKLLEKAQQ